MAIFGIQDSTLLGFAGGIIAVLILTALKNVLSRLIKIKPKQLGWLGLFAAATAIYFTSYRVISYYLFILTFLWFFILIKGWRVINLVKKEKENEKKEKKVIKTRENRGSKRRWKKTIRI